MIKSQKNVRLEPGEIITFLLNVVFLKTVKTCSMNPEKQGKNCTQSLGSSSHTFLNLFCTLNCAKLNLFFKTYTKMHHLNKGVPTQVCVEPLYVWANFPTNKWLISPKCACWTIFYFLFGLSKNFEEFLIYTLLTKKISQTGN